MLGSYPAAYPGNELQRRNPKPYVLGIDVQSSFDNDFVEVMLDGKSIIKEALSTNHVLGVCPEGRERMDVSAGPHTLNVTIDDHSATEEFVVEKDRYLGIMFDPQSHNISVQYSDRPFMYD